MKKKRILSGLLALCFAAALLGGCQIQQTDPVTTEAPAAATAEPDKAPEQSSEPAQSDETPEQSAVPAAEEEADAVQITLSAGSALVNGEAVPEYDYCWHADISTAHEDVKNAPAEYYTGTEPGDEAVYIAHDINYYPEIAADSFVKTLYDGEYEWAAYYTAEGYEDYIFGTLPYQNGTVPTGMMHSEEEAWDNAVLHITCPGRYVLEGQWNGQILIDLGDSDDTFADETAKVTLVLNGVDVTCTVAPALIFRSVYECDNGWEERGEYSASVDTADAGANVIITDGTVNTFSGTNVFRMLKTKYKDEEQQVSEGEAKTQKKMRKTDGAFYSYQSMNIGGGSEGSGVLNIVSGFEGLDTELHLTINGGHVNVYSQDDGINVNEDGVSVLTVNGGCLHILAGLGSEGDGVDSNGFLTINGGTVISMASPMSDSGLDSDCGSYVNGGTVVALGSTMDWAEADDSNDSGAVTMNLQFAGYQSSDEAIIVTDTAGRVVFAYDPDKDEVAGTKVRSYQGAVLSCPEFTVGESYYVYVGGDVEGTESAGVYDASTVTGFSDSAVQQVHYGSFEQMGGPGGQTPPSGDLGGFGDGQEPPEGGFGGFGDGQEPPEGDFGGFGDGQEPPEGDFGGFGDGQEPPEGGFGGSGDGQEPPEGGFGGSGDGQTPPNGDFGGFGGPGGMGNTQSGEASAEFTMTDQVNNFSGVSDIAA